MKRTRRKFSSEFKVKVLREQLENQIPVGKLCERYGIEPNMYYIWKKELFIGALETFSQRKSSKTNANKIAKLEEKLQEKDSIISEIVEDNLRLKKKLNGEY